MRWVEAILDASELAGLFDAMSTADDVERTKPDPAPYVLAAQKLGLEPSECVAIEDSVNGVTSAVAAGCHTIQLRATATAAASASSVAQVIHSLAEFPFELVADAAATR
jgi:beta-phosphoglucomutase-like phosphatase (HAD superfamily)